jgi:hypothetical protein
MSSIRFVKNKSFNPHTGQSCDSIMYCILYGAGTYLFQLDRSKCPIDLSSVIGRLMPDIGTYSHGRRTV